MSASVREGGLRTRRTIASDLQISPVCVGVVTKPRLIIDAFEAGINFFFCTADMHWPYYKAWRLGIRQLLARKDVHRSEIVVAAVSYVTAPEFCHAPFREFIEAVSGLSTIDMTIIGGTYGHDLVPRLEQYGLHRNGGPRQIKGVRATGATFHDRCALTLAVNHSLVDLAFLRYNPDHPGAEEDVFPQLRTSDRPPIYNFNTIRGKPTDDEWLALSMPDGCWKPTAADYYRFALTRPEISGLLVSLSSENAIRSLERAFELGPLEESESSYLKTVADLVAGRSDLG